MIVYMRRQSSIRLQPTLLHRLISGPVDLNFNIAVRLLDFDVEDFCLADVWIGPGGDLERIFGWTGAVFFDCYLVRSEVRCCD
jgi:hypothetical protein